MSRVKLIPKNWAAFQHYKDRSPPWIKLHKSLLDDRKYQRLPIASKALAPMLWLIASESKDGIFDGSVDELVFRLRAEEGEIEAGLAPLIDAGFFVPVGQESAATQASCETGASAPMTTGEQLAGTVLAACEQVAVPETETEAEGKTEAEGADAPAGKASLPRCDYEEIVVAYHRALPSLPRVKLLQDGRKKSMTKVWRWVLTSKTAAGERRATNAVEAVDWFRDYFERAAKNDFLNGRGERNSKHAGWMADLDFLLTDRGMKHVIEKTLVSE